MNLATTIVTDAHKPDLEIGRELAEWRDRAGLTQKEAATALGISGVNTISRWETGLRTPGSAEYKRAMALYRRLAAERQQHGVPRGTTPGVLPPALEQLAVRFEREAARLGATDPELDHIHWALRNPETSRMFYLGASNAPMSDAEQLEELGYQIDGLRLWLEHRLAKRGVAPRSSLERIRRLVQEVAEHGELPPVRVEELLGEPVPPAEPVAKRTPARRASGADRRGR